MGRVRRNEDAFKWTDSPSPLADPSLNFAIKHRDYFFAVVPMERNFKTAFVFLLPKRKFRGASRVIYHRTMPQSTERTLCHRTDRSIGMAIEVLNISDHDRDPSLS